MRKRSATFSVRHNENEFTTQAFLLRTKPTDIGLWFEFYHPDARWFLRWHLVSSARLPVNSQSLRKSVYHLALTLAQFYNPRTEPLRQYSPREIEAISVTLHALRLYVKKYTKEPETTEPDTDTVSE